MAVAYYAKAEGVSLESAALLSPARQARVERLKKEEDKKCAIAAELLLQHACREQGIAFDPDDLVYPERGKPHFKTLPLKFNYTHSEGVTVCVVGKAEVGADIEVPRPHHQKIARRFLSEECQSRIFAADDPDVAFVEEWLCIESHAKATGEGIYSPPFDKPMSDCWLFTKQTVLGEYRICVCHELVDTPVSFVEVTL